MKFLRALLRCIQKCCGCLEEKHLCDCLSCNLNSILFQEALFNLRQRLTDKLLDLDILQTFF